ncbi:hypothetical protein HFD88_005546 [Aspergillus terreus]|nr:hypothetical protein HFD88_005546 [Aspergillus terreus]
MHGKQPKQTHSGRRPKNAEFLDLCQALSPLLQELTKEPPTDPLEEITDGSPSRQEWIRLKKEKAAKSESLDQLMRMVGLEDAKEAFLQIWGTVQIAQKQGKTLSSSDLDIAIVGNPGAGKSTVKSLYDGLMRELGVSGSAYTYKRDKPVDEKRRLELPDYTDDELLKILVERIRETKWRISGGPNGKFLQMLVRVVGSARGKGFRNVYALQEAWDKALDRQTERIREEQRRGRRPDYLLLTMDDLIGPDPAQVHRESAAWARLQGMIGLEAVKAAVQLLFHRVTQNYRRVCRGQTPLHSTLNRVFLGPPGTGKTTVGTLYAQILADLGLLSSGEVVVKNPSDLIGPYVGWSEKQTKEILDHAKGKVLIIDDAYMLYPGDQSGAGRETDVFRVAIIDTLVAEIDNVPGNDCCVILMGYEDQMQEMFRKSNPGLARRFSLADAFRFTDYSADELGQILDLKMREQGVQATGAARETAMQVLEMARHRPNFGNGGDVENLLSRAQEAYEKRMAEVPPPDTAVPIILEPQDFDPFYDRHREAAAQCEAHFHDLVELGEIVAQFQEYQKAVAGMRRHGVDPRPHIPFTFVFRGPPGTGKTSTARKVGQIYYDMGFLSAAEVVECSVSDLLAQYQGQTGKLVVDLLERALGKVLFIDEAYRLAGSGYEKQAVGELVDGLTKRRYKDKLVVVLSGYTPEMMTLLQVNRGLRSRFPTDIVFHPLSPGGCWRLLQRELQQAGIPITDLAVEPAATAPTEIFSRLVAMHSWANARDVKRLAGDIIRQVFGRLSDDSDLGINMRQVRWRLETAELDMAVTEAETRVAMTAQESAERHLVLSDLSLKMFHRHERRGKMQDLEAAVAHGEQALNALPDEDPRRAGYVNNCSIFRSSRYKRTGNLDDLEAAITNANLAVAATPDDHPDRAAYLNNLSNHLSSRYERTGDLDDLEAAITNTNLAVAATPEDHPDRAAYLNNLARHLSSRFERTGNLDDLEAAITNANLAVAATPDDHPDRAGRLNNLSNRQSSRFERTGNLDDLEAAITNANLAVATTPDDHPDRAGRLNNLSNRQSSRFERTGNLDDLEAAITNANLAVAATPDDHPDRAGRLNNLSNRQSSRFKRTGDLDDLEAAITNANLAVAATPDDHPDRAAYLNNLSNHLSSRYERTGDLDDLEAAITNANLAVAATPDDHPDRAGRLNNLSNRQSSRFKRTGDLDDLEAAITNANLAVAATPDDHPDRASCLSNLSNRQSSRFERTGNLDDLEAAITNANLAVAATPDDHPDRAGRLNNLSNRQSSRFERTGNLDDLEAAITNANLAVATTPDDHPDRAGRLNNLAGHLSNRFKRTGDLDDLEAAITNANLAVAATPEDHPDRAGRLNNLAGHLSSRFKRTGDLDDLEAAITNANLAVAATPEDHPDRAAYLNNLSNHLSSRYERTGNLDDLEAAITNANLAVAATPEDHPDRAAYLNNLTNHLSSRYERTGNLDDLDAAITNANLAMAATPDDHPDRAAYLNNLSNHLSSRYERTGALDDLEAAITNANLAVAATPDDHPDRAGRLNNLSNRQSSRFERTGNLDDLEAAITNANLAVATTPDDHPDRASCLSNLSNRQSSRFERTGNLDDLEAAITNANLAVAATPDDHPDRAAYLNNLSNHLSSRYERTGNLDDLEAAITNANLAVAATPDDHPDRASCLSNLSNRQSSRFKRTGNLDDLEAAITNTNLAVAATPEDHPDRAAYLNNLSNHLSSRYERTGNLDDLEAAITNANLALTATPEDHPDRASCLNNLAGHLIRRYERTGNPQDIESALQYVLAAAKLPNAIPLHRIQSARQAIRILHRQHRHDDAASLAEMAVQLLPLVCARYLSRDDQQHAITRTAGLAADACSIFLELNRPAKALQQLEFGRGLILGYLIDSRGDIDQLQKDHPALAEEYDRLRFILSQSPDTVPPESREQLLQGKKNAPRELENCLAAIRRQKGYERFLLEPAVEDLTKQTADGPVVIINITDFGGHAIILQGQEVRSLRLPDMGHTPRFALENRIQRYRVVGERGRDPRDPRDMESELGSFSSLQTPYSNHYDAESLHWLWSACVKPVLSHIPTEARASEILPRIWWIGTGAASALPFHAAGDHSHPSENTFSRAISSYTPTVKALAYARSRLTAISPPGGTPAVLIAAMPTTPGELPLPGVEVEVDAIQEAAGLVFTVRLAKYPAPEAVLHAMEDTDIIHFACHGSSDPTNPSRSHLLLHRSDSPLPTVGQLTVQQISDRVFQRARIAYLSACSTAQVTASRLTDEALHLASAFQVAGFGHVVASLWSVDDATCAHMAKAFYSYLAATRTGALSNRLVAEALHAAVLRVRSSADPRVWASFIHYGA